MLRRIAESFSLSLITSRSCTGLAAWFALALQIISFVLFSGFAKAQSNSAAGILPFSTHEFGIDLATSNITTILPLRSKVGKIPFAYAITSNSQAYKNGSHWIVSTGFYGHPTGAAQLINTVMNYTQNSADCPTTTWYHISFTDATGAQHPIPAGFQISVCQGGSLPPVTTTDGSGYTFVVMDQHSGPWMLYDASGNGADMFSGGYEKDPDSTQISAAQSGNVTTYTDTLNATPIVATINYSNESLGDTYKYTDVNGNTQQYAVSYSSFSSLGTAFGCTGVTEWSSGSLYLPTQITRPDGTKYTVSYGSTGRVSKIVYPWGGYISYSYSGGNNGINCSSGVVPVLTVTANDNNGNSNTWTFNNSNSSSTPGNFTVTETDPAGNQTVHNFAGEYQTQLAVYQGGCPTSITGCAGGGTLLKTVTTCYGSNGSAPPVPPNCAAPSAVPFLPITETDVYTSLNGSSASILKTTFDIYGNATSVLAYDFGATTPTIQTFTSYGQSWNGTSCSAYPSGTYIYTTPCYSHTENSSGADIARTQITYSNTGHPTSTMNWVSGSSWLTSSSTYNSNGTVATATDVSGTVATFAYNGPSGCNGLLPTSVTTSGLTTSRQWNCDGGVKVKDFDANGNATIYGYVNSSGTADPFWRASSITDPLNNVVWTNYGTNTVETTRTFGSSTEDSITTVDGSGRRIRTQTRNGSSYDTVTYKYSYSGTGATISTSVPCSAALGADCTTGFTVAAYDGSGRLSSTVDGGGGTVNNTYTQNDVISTLSPHPSNENNKTTQVEFDGLGRTKSTCPILSSGGSSCGQFAGGSGIPTTYTYSLSAGSITTLATRGAETRTTVKDALGRVISQTTPEGGTKTYIYDSWSPGLCGWTSQPGQLMAINNPDGSLSCYVYQSGLGRLSDVGWSGPAGSQGECKHFRYDTSANGIVSAPGTINNAAGHMVEATTDNCTVYPPTSATIITDEWFSYDKLGNVTDVWELTPHSLGYLHTFASWYPNGQLNTLNSSGLGTTSGITGIGALTYGLDANGKPSTTMMGSNPIVAGVTYGPVGPTTIDVGAGTDQDVYTYSPSTGQMTNYKFYVGSANVNDALTWNTNGTLGSLGVTDGLDAGGSQTCAFGYDDVARLTSDNCGSVWAQTFSYDQYDNLTKSGSSSWNPGYNTKNQYSSVGATYDANGNLTYDGYSHYTWDVFGKLTGVNVGGAINCGSSGTCVTYDAFGRMAEENQSGLQLITLYSPIGKIALVYNYANQGIIYVYTAEIPLPGGGTLAEGGGAFYLHKDWLGTARVGQSVPSSGNGSVFYDYAFAPYGEEYDKFGQSSIAGGFTGDWSYLIFGGPLYDTPNRELHNGQGRWLSPDPAGAAWNQYAYTTNPNSFTDPSGLCPDCRIERFDALGSQSEPCFVSPGCIMITGFATPNEMQAGLDTYLSSIPGYYAQGGNLWVHTGSTFVPGYSGNCPPSESNGCGNFMGTIVPTWVNLGSNSSSGSGTNAANNGGLLGGLWSDVTNWFRNAQFVGAGGSLWIAHPKYPPGWSPGGNVVSDGKNSHICLSLASGGVGAKVPGGSAGPLFGNPSKAFGIIQGASLNINVNFIPTPIGFVGGQMIISSAGVLAGPTIGTSGVSVSASYSWPCD